MMSSTGSLTQELFDGSGLLLRKNVYEYDNDGRLLTEQNYEIDIPWRP